MNYSFADLMSVVFFRGGPFAGPEFVKCSKHSKRSKYLFEDNSAISKINLRFFFIHESCTDNIGIFLSWFVELFKVFLKLLFLAFHHIFQLALKLVFILFFLFFPNFPISVSLHFYDN